MKERIIDYWRAYRKQDYTSGKVVAVVIALPAILLLLYWLKELMMRVYFQ